MQKNKTARDSAQDPLSDQRGYGGYASWNETAGFSLLNFAVWLARLKRAGNSPGSRASRQRKGEEYMRTEVLTEHEKITREEMIDLLNEDLAREYQAIIAYTVYS